MSLSSTSSEVVLASSPTMEDITAWMFLTYTYTGQTDLLQTPGLYPDPLSNSVAYTRIAEVNQTTDKRTSETIRVLAKEKHVILAFHNYGACSTLFSVKVTYNGCPDKTLRSSLVSLTRTVAPANDSEPTRVEGNCVKDTVQVYGSLYVHCESNGEWNTTGLEGRCICKEDMQNNDGICKGNVTVVAFTVYSIYYLSFFFWLVFFFVVFSFLLGILKQLSHWAPSLFPRRSPETSTFYFALFRNAPWKHCGLQARTHTGFHRLRKSVEQIFRITRKPPKGY